MNWSQLMADALRNPQSGGATWVRDHYGDGIQWGDGSRDYSGGSGHFAAGAVTGSARRPADRGSGERPMNSPVSPAPQTGVAQSNHDLSRPNTPQQTTAYAAAPVVAPTTPSAPDAMPADLDATIREAQSGLEKRATQGGRTVDAPRPQIERPHLSATLLPAAPATTLPPTQAGNIGGYSTEDRQHLAALLNPAHQRKMSRQKYIDDPETWHRENPHPYVLRPHYQQHDPVLKGLSLGWFSTLSELQQAWRKFRIDGYSESERAEQRAWEWDKVGPPL